MTGNHGLSGPKNQKEFGQEKGLVSLMANAAAALFKERRQK